MELGALICTARAWMSCPVSDLCRWRRTGNQASPADRHRRNQSHEGTDRQCRGALLAAQVRADEPVSSLSCRTIGLTPPSVRALWRR